MPPDLTATAPRTPRVARVLPRGLHYGWVVVAVTFATVLVASAIRAAPSVFILPLEAEFGWDRAALATAVAINLVLFGVAAPIAGYLIDRFGPRIVMLISMGFLALGVAGTVFMRTIWQLDLLWGVVIGLSAGGAGSVLGATVATRWFVARRGLVVGLLSSSNSAGQLVFIPTLMMLIVSFEWRVGAAVLALCALAMLVPIFVLMRNDPSDIGGTPFGVAPGPQPVGAQARGGPVRLSELIRAPEFLLLAGSFFMCGSTANGLVGTHLIPHSVDHGIPEVTAAAAVGVMGGMNFVGTMLSGYLTDRFDPRRLLAVFFTFRGLSLFVLPFVSDFSGLLIFTVVYGLDWFATVPPTIALAAQRFGRRSVGSVYGWLYLSHQVGGGIAAFAGGAIYTWLGDYQLAFLTGGLLAIIGGCLALLVRAQHPAPTPMATAA